MSQLLIHWSQLTLSHSGPTRPCFTDTIYIHFTSFQPLSKISLPTVILCHKWYFLSTIPRRQERSDKQSHLEWPRPWSITTNSPQANAVYARMHHTMGNALRLFKDLQRPFDVTDAYPSVDDTAIIITHAVFAHRSSSHDALASTLSIATWSSICSCHWLSARLRASTSDCQRTR